MVRCGILFFSFFLYSGLYAQSEPQFTQYMYNRYLSNPAYAGSTDALEFHLIHRSQYVGLANRAIASQGFNFNMPVYSISSGIGLTAVNDFIGLQRATYVALNYDYRKSFKWGKMSIGIGAGIVQTSIDGAKIRTPEGNYNDGQLNHNDQILPDNLQQGIAPDFSFGLYFNNDRYFAGAAIQHIAFSSATIDAVTQKTKLNFARNIVVSGGYDFQVGKKWSVMPSVLVKTDLRKVQLDVGANVTIIQNILTGISFRGYEKNTIDALALMLGFRYKGFQAVYSYDASLSYLTKFNTGSHEVSLSYRYKLKKKESKGYFYHNPRFD
ncbi:MAG: PorP/SprF family type IX secretion system membrane protein [Bacteroidetes bacterium]|nr:PorP/SprF family type IX secretion system membrane protein [Bacteroidota bacterium]